MTIKKIKTNTVGFQSNFSIYKDKFTDQNAITYKPKFSITKNITFSNHKKIANNLAKALKRFQPL